MRKLAVFGEVLSIKLLWLPLIFALPIASLCPSNGKSFLLFGAGIPISIALHEFLHVLLLPSGSFSLRKGAFIAVEITGNVPAFPLFVSALLPGLVLGSVGVLLLPHDALVAFPFVMHLLSVPLDIAGIGGIRLG
ncbi:hypothetical protein [Thermococcus thioreducens]|uniref:Zincin peptidase n=1 Tax=Thermococcus thioreducens TaxID=277988 RepID=A0A0Q2QSD5_9EURY|nr:hypothetical protein [Thermococcus thioreducens]ASJ12200.1 hypothetical protein A3L14_04555 [Thermococcus thioreducens]KQH82941.1 hypothetical protein AMR53_01550 [Thermococcus thioreducens]SEV95013.1 hypothetical protein SAMN05216170_1056 [Thermococcus thioreducens]